MSDDLDVPPRDEQQAARLISATVLIGLTWLNGDGAPEHEQMFGVIKTTDARRGFEIALKGTRAGDTYWLPPDTRNFQAAPPGEYRLKSTGEVVSNPDFTSTWSINSPSN